MPKAFNQSMGFCVYKPALPPPPSTILFLPLHGSLSTVCFEHSQPQTRLSSQTPVCISINITMAKRTVSSSPKTPKKPKTSKAPKTPKSDKKSSPSKGSGSGKKKASKPMVSMYMALCHEKTLLIHDLLSSLVERHRLRLDGTNPHCPRILRPHILTVL